MLLNKYNANFAITSNLLLLLGKKFKSNELMSGRMAEILGSLYIIYALDWFKFHNVSVKNIVTLAKYEEFHKIQKNYNDIVNNYPIYPVKLLLKFILNDTFLSKNMIITDTMIKNASDSITKNNNIRKIYSENIHLNERMQMMNDNLDNILLYQISGKNDNEHFNKIIHEVISVDAFEK